MWWWLILACGGEASPTPAVTEAPPPAVDARAAALEQADAAAKKLGSTLKARMSEAMVAGGPPQAIGVCSGEAQAMTAQIASDSGAKLGRTSARLRNPMNGAPEWVFTWLQENEGKPAAEVKGFSRVDDTPLGSYARVVKPIAVEAGCLVCHGPKDSLDPAVVGLIAERYATDAAVGYAEGDLRGALWAEVALPK